MRNKFITCLSLVSALFLCGCSGLTSTPPTKAESAVYNVSTNLLPVPAQVTNTVVLTNFVPITVTNTVAGAPVIQTVTNTVFVTNATVTTVTNYVQAQQFSVAPATTATIQAGGAVLNTFLPGVGTIVASAVAGMLGLWGTLRSKQATTAQAVAANSVQAIEVARNLTASISPSAATAFNNWLVQHQADAGIASEVAKVVDEIVNTNVGQAAGVGAAQQILAAAAQPIPVPPKV